MCIKQKLRYEETYDDATVRAYQNLEEQQNKKT